MDQKMHFTFFDCQIIEGEMQRRVHQNLKLKYCAEFYRYRYVIYSINHKTLPIL
jgi:hypothetical protein